MKADDVEVTKDEEEDEFAPYFLHGKVRVGWCWRTKVQRRSRCCGVVPMQKPKIMITTQNKASSPTYQFIKDLIDTLPNAYYYKRGATTMSPPCSRLCLRFHTECMASTGMFELKKICKWAAKKKFTHLIILNEKAKKLNACVCATCVPARGPSDMSWLLQHVHQPSALRADCHVQTVVVYAGC